MFPGCNHRWCSPMYHAFSGDPHGQPPGNWGLSACSVLIQPTFLYPPKCPLPDENSVLSVAHSGGAMETGLSHPLLIESSLGGGGPRKMSKWNSILPKCCLKLKSSVSQSSLPHSPGHTQAAVEVGGASLPHGHGGMAAVR